jgi:hypothetical protein
MFTVIKKVFSILKNTAPVWLVVNENGGTAFEYYTEAEAQAKCNELNQGEV